MFNTIQKTDCHVQSSESIAGEKSSIIGYVTVLRVNSCRQFQEKLAATIFRVHRIQVEKVSNQIVCMVMNHLK